MQWRGSRGARQHAVIAASGIALSACANTAGGGGASDAAIRDTSAEPRDGGVSTSDGAIVRRDAGRTGACGSLAIRQVQAPVALGAACTTPRTVAAERVLDGTLDVALRDTYTLRPLLEWSGASRLTVQGAVVELREGSPNGPLVGPSFSIYADTRMDGGRVDAPSVESTEFGVIVPQVTSALRSVVCRLDESGVTSDCPVARITASIDRRLLVRVYVFGITDDGCTIASEPFSLPVTVCCGCLRRFPVESDAPEAIAAGPDCNAGASPSGPASCALGQDFPVDCRLCSGANVRFCQPRGYRASSTACPVD